MESLAFYTGVSFRPKVFAPPTDDSQRGRAPRAVVSHFSPSNSRVFSYYLATQELRPSRSLLLTAACHLQAPDGEREALVSSGRRGTGEPFPHSLPVRPTNFFGSSHPPKLRPSPHPPSFGGYHPASPPPISPPSEPSNSSHLPLSLMSGVPFLPDTSARRLFSAPPPLAAPSPLLPSCSPLPT